MQTLQKMLSRNCVMRCTLHKHFPITLTRMEGSRLKQQLELLCQRQMSSKTPVSKSSLAKPAEIHHPDPIYNNKLEPVSYSKDLVHIQSQEEKLPSRPRKRKTEILRMDPKEYEGAAIGVEKPSLLERRGEANLILRHLAPPGKRDTTKLLLFFHQDIDLSPANLKRIWRSIDIEQELKAQEYNPKRVSVLGPDLGAAHFLVARSGKIRFQNHQEWITTYRKDALTEKDPRDLPNMTLDLCTMPVNYDPNYRVEAIDASGVKLYYDGLSNFENLNHVTWVNLQNSPLLNDWYLDRIIYLFSETLEYLDLSGCTDISDRGLAALWRMKNLKTLVVNNLEHVQNLEIVCAHLEDRLPGLICIGVDYEKKIVEVRNKTAQLERDYKEEMAALEANTINVIPRVESESDPSPPQYLKS